MASIQFIETNPNDLITELKKSLIPELMALLALQVQPKRPSEYITRSEFCTIFDVDQSTEYRWRKDGTIPSYGIGNRVYFKRSEIDKIINQNKLS